MSNMTASLLNEMLTLQNAWFNSRNAMRLKKVVFNGSGWGTFCLEGISGTT